MEISQRHVVRAAALVAVTAALGAPAGCAAPQNIVTPYYALTAPAFWTVTQTAKREGEPTKVVVGQFGEAVIDSGSDSSGGRYDAVTADVSVWIYAWPLKPSAHSPQDEAYLRLSRIPPLELASHLRIPELPLECGLFGRSFRLAGKSFPSLDLVRRPGFRTVVLGATLDRWLLGIVARVDFEQDVARYCHNLRNMRTQLQNLLDGLHSVSASPPPPN